MSIPDIPDTQSTAPQMRYSFLDFLFPEKLLDRARVSENMLIRYSDIRSRRSQYRTSLISLEVVIYILLFVIFQPMWIGTVKSVISTSLYPWTSGFNLLEYLPWVIAFLTLRLHLLINDQSRHMKSLHKSQLEHLLLTKLLGDNYFPHHLLRLCWTYPVLIRLSIVILMSTSFHFSLLTRQMWNTSC